MKGPAPSSSQPDKPGGIAPIEEQFPLLRNLQACTTAKKIVQLVNWGVLTRCSFEHLVAIRDRLIELQGTARKKEAERLQPFINILEGHIGSDEISRGLFIQYKVEDWLGEPDGITEHKIQGLIDFMALGGDKWRPCSPVIAMADILEELRTHREVQLLSDPSLSMKTGAYFFRPKTPVLSCISSAWEQSSPLQLLIPEDHHLERLHRERLFRLTHCHQIHSQLLSDPSQCVASKFFPPTQAWLLGVAFKPPVEIFEQELLEIGLEHGIKIIAPTYEADPPEHEASPLEGHRQAIGLAAFLEAPWPQDYVDFSLCEVRVPAMKHEERHSAFDIINVINLDRQQRHRLWRYIPPLAKAPLWRTTDRVRMSWFKSGARHAIALAAAADIPCVMNLTYSEGGNTLLGERKNNKPCAIIGLDTVAATRALLSYDLGAECDEATLRAAFAIDYGIEDIVFVEQLGDFHLDMCMAFVGPGQVIVSDSVAAARQYEPHLRVDLDSQGVQPAEIDEICTKLIEEARTRQSFENLAAKQLRAAGFEVERIAGRFFRREPKGFKSFEDMNFFNFVTATTPMGQRIILALGVESQEFEGLFQGIWEEKGVDYIYFMDLNKSQICLAQMGGLSCRTKSIA